MNDKQDPANLPYYTNHSKTKRRSGVSRLFVVLVSAFVLSFLGLRVVWLATSKPIFLLEVDDNVAVDPRLNVYQAIDAARECHEWESTSPDSDVSKVSFALAEGADLIFALTRGPIAGHFEMIRRTNYSYPDRETFVTAEVTTRSPDQATKVCRMGNEDKKERGVLIWRDAGLPLTSINVTIIIPLHLRSHKDVSTDLAMFSHSISSNFDDWWSPTYFRDMRFMLSEAPIDFDGLRARSVAVHTSDGAVRGSFDGNSINVQTSNAPISFSAFMEGLDAGSNITLRTSNATIEAMFGVSHSMVNTTVRAHVHTTHGAVRLLTDPFQSMHPNSTFMLNVSTSDAPVAVYMGPSYEGTYELSTTEARAEVDNDDNVEDPSEMGRQRTVQWTTNEEHDYVRGYSYWSHNGDPSREGMDRGAVKISSTKSDVTLYF
ncbi:hypothetical protein R3P38DRAFT_2908866 [Favolaschia claudopus]|uniref:Uncharacterized protein n=1 Tax=Favolaschia claudopus TaxID=2862362 RepID=A0AAW0C9B0_9AGAR